AWLAALPVLAALASLFRGDASGYVIGVLGITCAMVMLRSRGVSLFVEQLAIPILLAGGGAFASALFRDLDLSLAAGSLALLALVLGTLLAQAWLRVLLGAVAASLTVFAAVTYVGERDMW